MGLLKDAGDQRSLTDALILARQLAVSYAGLTLLMDMFPQVCVCVSLCVWMPVFLCVCR